jgi:DNA-binding HxlR family transcriptional regulator
MNHRNKSTRSSSDVATKRERTNAPVDTDTDTDTGHPIMVLLDLLGRRWTLRILWELRGGKAFTFRDLQAACGGLSPNVLNTRLSELREAGVVAVGEKSGYLLSDAGIVLVSLLQPLSAWSNEWARSRISVSDAMRGNVDSVAAARAKPRPTWGAARHFFDREHMTFSSGCEFGTQATQHFLKVGVASQSPDLAKDGGRLTSVCYLFSSVKIAC